jgi:hypothetical protein
VIILGFPVLDTKTTISEQWFKVLEEFEEVRQEIESVEIDHERVISEMQDLIQAMVSLEYSMAKQLGMKEHFVQKRFDIWNNRHLEKMQRYKAERGWD